MDGLSEQKTDAAQLSAWLEERQKSLPISRTTVTEHGQTIDWVPLESQHPQGVPTPPPSSKQHLVDPERVTAGARFETVEGPAGHVPVLRPDVARLTGKTSLEFLRKVGGRQVNPHRRSVEPTDPNPAGYFHCTTAKSESAYGCDGELNVWDPQVDVPSSPGDDHSISQTWLQNYQTGHTQSIEAGLTVDHSLNGDAANHLFTYYTTNGYTADGDNEGGYNRLHAGWHQYDASVFPGIRINGSSAIGGGQLEIGIKFQLWQGNWWFAVSNSPTWIWLGYYPASLFPGGLNDHAEWVSFGGEVYSALGNPCSTTDQMGSGRHAADGWTYAAYQRLLRYQYSATNGAMTGFDGSAETDVASGSCPAGTYTIDAHLDSGSNWGSYQYFGGPSA